MLPHLVRPLLADTSGVTRVSVRTSPPRRLAIWLAARPQEPSFAQGLARFINTGAMQRELKNQLRVHARSGDYTDRAEAARLMQYCIARGADLGPVGDRFGSACHQMDRADLMLADARDRNRHGTGRRSRQASPDADGPQITALACYDPQRQTVTFVLQWSIRCVTLLDQLSSPLTGTGLSTLARLTRQLGMPALHAAWQQVTGQPVPQAIRDYIASHDAQPGGTP